MIRSVFAERKVEGRPVLIPYVTAGHPTRESTVPVLEAVAGAGADVLELGIPFSDPIADGPTIQRSSFVALENGTTVERVLEDLAVFRARCATPVVLFTYLNPILRYGFERFLSDAAEAGAQGLLLTDLPAGSDTDLESAVTASPLDFVRLAAPTTPLKRIHEIAQHGSGFLYYISRTGVTGAREALAADLEEEVRVLRAAVELPVAVGFGISTPEQAALIGGVADGVIVGSALIQALDEGGPDGGRAFLATLRLAMDQESTQRELTYGP